MQTKFSRKELERLNCSEEEISLIMNYQKRFPIILDSEDNIEKFCINARDLYKEIIQSEDTSNFSRWIKRSIKNYGFIENADFSTISPIGRKDVCKRLDYRRALNLAKGPNSSPIKRRVFHGIM